MSKAVEEDRRQQDSKEQASRTPMSSSPSTQAISSIGSYCLANMAMTVTNKYVFSVPTPFPLFQSVFSISYTDTLLLFIGRRVQSSLYDPAFVVVSRF